MGFTTLLIAVKLVMTCGLTGLISDLIGFPGLISGLTGLIIGLIGLNGLISVLIGLTGLISGLNIGLIEINHSFLVIFMIY